MRHTTILLIMTISALLAACGYQFVGVGQLPAGIERIHVAVLENPTAEIGIETILSNALIEAFTLSGHPVAPTRDSADAILSGRIAKLDIGSIARKTTLAAQSGRVRLSLALSLVSSEGQNLWSTEGIGASQVYEIIPGSKFVTEENRRSAITSLSKRLAEDVYDRLTTGF